MIFVKINDPFLGSKLILWLKNMIIKCIQNYVTSTKNNQCEKRLLYNFFFISIGLKHPNQVWKKSTTVCSLIKRYYVPNKLTANIITTTKTDIPIRN